MAGEMEALSELTLAGGFTLLGCMELGASNS